MREILFRGKRCDNGKWVEGDLHQCNHQYDRIITKFAIVYSVKHSTVCQYAGIDDKNGKRIFEGDVVVYDNSSYNPYFTPRTGVIEWYNGSLCFKHVNSEYNNTAYWPLCSDVFFGRKCEVIGNIHDNPDLIERSESE